ncbi:dolichol-phosphate mannosyltransferase [Halobacillus karajensis]|uniref:glycosyltransferase family 2 protein n=1 Tax=Halobacillus karajensis TaxID=195088 RepID=UPI0008A788A5|nr:glycosyltransferase family 2 protein [Halobacillus karajensis]SEI02454.1 dolichol-phosphate mannosyltransferase [Halobacillus karajensis]
MISVVVPVYGCRTCLDELCSRITRTIESIPSDYEILLINDHSPDQAWDKIQKICEENPQVRGFDLSRNFGQHHAITAGLDHTKGDWVVVMDCDLQDQPEEIKRLYEKAQEGYEVVFGAREVRKDRVFKRLSSKLFYKVYDYLTDRTSDYTIANFSICSSGVIESFRDMREQNRLFPLFIKWMGYKSTTIPVEHASRSEGKSSYNLKKMISLATDVIISQSNKPLRLSIQFGFLMSLGSFIYGLYLFFRYFFLAQPVQGWTSVMVSIYFIGGIIFFNFGIIGLYLGKVFNETKGRPLYIIRERTDVKHEERVHNGS